MVITLPREYWTSLSGDIRAELRKEFNIKRSEGSVVVANKIVSDGSTHQDLQAITVEGMQKYTGSTSSDFGFLFDLTLAKAEKVIKGEAWVLPEQIEIETITPEITQDVETIKTADNATLEEPITEPVLKPKRKYVKKAKGA